MRNIKTTAFAPFEEEKLDPRYSSGRDYNIGCGNQKGVASRDNSTLSDKKRRETGLIERKPL